MTDRNIPLESKPVTSPRQKAMDENYASKESTSLLDRGQDVGNIVLLEHLNIDIQDSNTALVFYCEGMGLTRDPTKITGSMWFNIGYQQFHEPLKKQPQIVGGTIGLVVPSLDKLCDDLKKIEKKLQSIDTKFRWEKVAVIESEAKAGLRPMVSKPDEAIVLVTCPYGNQFRAHQHNRESICFRGGFGIAYVELLCSTGVSFKLASFYEHYFGAIVQLGIVKQKGALVNAASISVGPWQELLFIEESDSTLIPVYDGYHIAIYVTNFSGIYKRLDANNLIFTNPKHADQVKSYEEALKISQFRFCEFTVDGKVIFQLEHEIRSMYHSCFMRPLVNRTGTIGLICNEV